MNSSYRANLSYYKQIYSFESLIASLTHQTWLESIKIPAKFVHDVNKTLQFQSQLLTENLDDLATSTQYKKNILFFISSLPKTSFSRVTKLITLALLKNDKSLLINGSKLKQLNSFFSGNEMNLLIQKNNIQLQLNHKFNVEKECELNEEYLNAISFYILSHFFQENDSALFQRFKLRFPQEIVLDNKFNFQFNFNTQINLSLLNSIAKLLFPKLYFIYESIEGSSNFENAYETSPIHAS